MIIHTNLRVTEKNGSHNQGINQDFVKNGQSKQYYSQYMETIFAKHLNSKGNRNKSQ